MVRRGLSACLVAALCGMPGRAAVAAAPWPAQMSADSDLYDVCFTDPQSGWAVGGQGSVWHTSDGGQTWQQQSAPVRCRLTSVHFVDRQYGWAVGGWTHAYTFRSSAVVLRTTDGGRQWTEASAPTLPMLVHIGFQDRTRGWAIGHGSALYPSGIFRTEDGGRRLAHDSRLGDLALGGRRFLFADLRAGGQCRGPSLLGRPQRFAVGQCGAAGSAMCPRCPLGCAWLWLPRGGGRPDPDDA